MKPTNVEKIQKVTKGNLIFASKSGIIESVCQDSRLATPNCAFFAIRGDAFDGHNFLTNAIENGAKLLIIDFNCATTFEDLPVHVQDLAKEKDVAIITLKDTVVALQDLARDYLKSLNCKKIAITGSTGKTTTRDMTYFVCKEKFKTQKNQGNFNTVVGVPLTILDFDEDIEVAVIEMGMDKAGEIDIMADIVRPDIALITNIGMSHLEHFENRDGIFAAKMEITNYFDEENILIVTENDEYLNVKYEGCFKKGTIKHDQLKGLTLAEIEDYENKPCKNLNDLEGNYKIILTGEDSNCQYFVSNIHNTSDTSITFDLEVKDEGKTYEVNLNLPGSHNALNATLAIAAGREVGVNVDEAIKGLAEVEITGKRLAIKEAGSIKVLDDTYNASPASMKAALDILSNMSGNRRIAILGDMYELGSEEVKLHHQIGEIAQTKADLVIGVGKFAKELSPNCNFKTIEELQKNLQTILKPGDIVLLKASRGMHLDLVAEHILNWTT